LKPHAIPERGKSNWILRKLPCVFVLSGGLGNQLFSYAAGVYYSKLNSRKVVFELSDIDVWKEYHSSSILKFSPNWPVIRIRFRKLVFLAIALIQRLFSFSHTRVIYGSPGLGHDIQMEKQKQALLVRGHYQTYKYLLDPEVASEMRKLSIKKKTDRFSMENAAIAGRKVLGVHVRLGNYSGLEESFGALSDEYFRNAIREALTEESSKIEQIYLYSDDVDKAYEYLTLMEWGVPVKLAGKNSGMTDEEILVLMSNSESLVISNSTFSWWAAALGNQDKRVYAPSKWFKGMNDPIDLYPPHWKLVESRWR
jgi:hypothetical protein